MVFSGRRPTGELEGLGLRRPVAVVEEEVLFSLVGWLIGFDASMWWCGEGTEITRKLKLSKTQ